MQQPLPVGTPVIPSAAAAVLSLVEDHGISSLRELHVSRDLTLDTLQKHLLMLLDLELLEEGKLVQLHGLDQGRADTAVQGGKSRGRGGLCCCAFRRNYPVSCPLHHRKLAAFVVLRPSLRALISRCL